MRDILFFASGWVAGIIFGCILAFCDETFFYFSEKRMKKKDEEKK